MVAANEAKSGTPTPVYINSPDGYRESYAVGAVDYATPGGTPTVSLYSAQGPASSALTNLVKPEVVAPGAAKLPTPAYLLFTAYPTAVSATGEGFVSGTSFAAPHVAGLAAWLLDAHPYLSVGELAYYIEHGTINGIGHQPDNIYGYGLINVYRSLSIVFAPGSCPGYFTDTSGILGSFYIATLSCASLTRLPTLVSCRMWLLAALSQRS